MVQLGELMMILELYRQGLSVTAIARRTGRDPKDGAQDIERGIEAPAYGPRSAGRPSKLAPYLDFLRERVIAFPDLGAAQRRSDRNRVFGLDVLDLSAASIGSTSRARPPAPRDPARGQNPASPTRHAALGAVLRRRPYANKR